MERADKQTGLRWRYDLIRSIAILVVLVPTTNSYLHCCDPGVSLKNQGCGDGHPIKLNCTNKFLLDPMEESDQVPYKFVFRDDGKLSLGALTYDEYCISHIHDKTLQPREVALVCDEFEDPAVWGRALAAVAWMSVACLVLTLLAHCCLRELRDLQGRCHMGAVSSLAIGFLILAVWQNTSGIEGQGPECMIGDFLIYYWMLSAFFWLNVTSFNVWRSIVLAHKHLSERKLYLWYSAVGWGMPLIMLVILIIVDSVPEDNVLQSAAPIKLKCWFFDDSTLRATWTYFYGPVAVLLTLNIVYFMWTTARLWRQYRDNSIPRRKRLTRRFALSLKLFLIMGIGWVFELISTLATPNIIWYVTDLFNALQGVIILLVLVVCRRRVWAALFRMRICGCGPSQRCSQTDDSTDSEDCDPEPDDDEELKDMPSRAADVIRIPS